VVDAIGVQTSGGRELHGISGGEVEAAAVERTVDDAALQAADRQRGAHVGTPVLDRHEPLLGVGEQHVAVAVRHPEKRARQDIADARHGPVRSTTRPGCVQAPRPIHDRRALP